jgi:dihydroorotase/N-acyl-D-amino-acid deacylase
VIAPRLIALLVCCGAFAQTPYDVVLRGGRVVDGTGNSWFYGDVAIRGDRIAKIAPAGVLSVAPARERIDVKGLVVAPGFIDIQSQSGDAFLTGDGRVIGKVTQGVTTEILGEGETEAPAKSGRFAGPHGFAAWLNAMHEHGTSVNFGSFVGAGTIRAYVKGMAQGEPTREEIETMQTLVRQAMKDGAFGIGSALIYPPGNYAGTHELGEMAKAMAPYGGVYITHMRSEADHVLEALDEAIEIGRAGGVPVEIYHLKEIGTRNWDKVSQVIAKIDSARASGIDVAADMYPYVAGGTGLTACLPPWTAADGKLFDNLADVKVRARIKAEIQSEKNDWENMGRLAGPEGILIVGVEKPENHRFVGKRLSEIEAMQHKDWMDAAMDLILADRSRIETLFHDERGKRQAAVAAAVDQDRHGCRRLGSRQHEIHGPSPFVWYLPAHFG